MTAESSKSDVVYQPLSPRQHREAAAMAARAMAPDPMSLAVFGEDGIRRVDGLTTSFRFVLHSLKRPPLCAVSDGSVIGLCAYARPGECFFQQMKARRTVGMGGLKVTFGVPSMPLNLLIPLVRLGSAMGRLSTWTEATAAKDPPEPHQHIELVAVEPERQGRGVGTGLMERTLKDMRQFAAMPYLETNTEVDVRFYTKFDFEVLDTIDVQDVTIRLMGIPNWQAEPKTA